MSELDKLKEKLFQYESDLTKAKLYIEKNEKILSLGALVAGFTHDLSTPIGLGVTGMSNFIELTNKIKKLYIRNEMTQDDFENYLEKAKKTADLVFTNLQSASELMLSFKKISVDQTSELKRRFNLHDYFDEVVQSLHNKLKHTNTQIQNSIDKDIELNSYAGMYSQIFINLILNSVLHAFKDKEEGQISVNAILKDEKILLEYKDNGQGISQENLSKIFNPFFTTKINDGGSGLGTTIIHNLVTTKLMGTIKVDSKENEGTTFTISVPLELK